MSEHYTNSTFFSKMCGFPLTEEQMRCTGVSGHMAFTRVSFCFAICLPLPDMSHPPNRELFSESIKL